MADGKCRINGDSLLECVDLGDQYVTDFVDKEHITAGDVASLKVGIGPTSGLVQLYDSYPPEKMYKRYWYKSGINESMRAQLKSIVESAMSFVRLKDGDTVLDIASNDGTMLSNYPDSVNRIGVDPSNVAAESELYASKGMTLVNDFFSVAAYEGATSKKAKIVSVIAMFYDLEDPVGFLRDVRQIIEDSGVLVLQISYTPLMLDENEFGFISHEHVGYYTLDILKSMLEETGFEVFDAQMNPTNGGSLRVYATTAGGIDGLVCPLNWLTIGAARVSALLAYEEKEDLRSPEPYHRFMRNIEQLKQETIDWLQQQAESGKKVVGYGASTKGNVLLQYYGLTPELLPCIAERSEEKWGLYTIGSGIPIISEDEMREMKPDYLFVLPWFFINAFLEREKDLLATGTRFVMPQPQLKVLD